MNTPKPMNTADNSIAGSCSGAPPGAGSSKVSTRYRASACAKVAINAFGSRVSGL